MKKLLLAALLAVTCVQTRAQLVINELMQSNIDCIMDDLNDFPDSWVELYNTGDTPVNLGQYKLGKNDKVNKAWQLPSLSVPANGYVIIYCDKANDDTDNLLHADFRLESGKDGKVYLFQGSEVVDFLTNMKKQPAPNIAYGRQTDGAEEWGYQVTPTPGAANCGEITNNILGEPIFSQAGSVMTGGSIELTLSLPDDSPEGAEIHYTRDGSEPTLQSPTYSSPLNINSTTVVRAKAFANGWLSPRSSVQSYIFFPATPTRPLTLPVVSIAIDNRYLNDPMIGIYCDGSYQSGKKNYEFDWRRPMNIEYFENGNEDSQLNQLCEMRIMGGASRSHPAKSLAVYANKRFGEKHLEYEFFPDQKPGLTDFKSIALRNAGNDFDYLFQRDAIIQCHVAQRVDLDWQAYRPIIIYINGVYKGMLNIRERSNEDNIYTNYDGLEDIDMIENWWELKEGSIDSFNAFKNFYTEHGHTLEEFAQWVDWEEFYNLMILNAFYCNVDFPGNNIVLWRPQADGGKWRFIAKDTDFGLGLYDRQANYNYFEWLHNPNYDQGANWGANSYDGTRLFRRMMENADLKREFIDRCAIYVGDFLNEEGTRAVWDPMYEKIKTEYPYHRNLYNAWWPNYDNELSKARDWLHNRADYFLTHLKNYYQLGTIRPMTINKEMSAEDLASVEITFNGVKLTEGTFDGKFFQGRNVTLQGTALGDKEVTGWTVRQVINGNETETTVSGSEYTFEMPASSQLTINAIVADPTGITHTPTLSQGKGTWYTLDGAVLQGKPTQPGIYINNGVKIAIK